MLEKSSPTPLYVQLKELIRRQIENGFYEEGKAIPSERELCRAYGVSRMTVRQAIAEAASEGLLFTRHGKGTYVAKRKIDQALDRITGFDKTMAGHGLLPVTSLVDVRRVPAGEEIAAALKVQKGISVVKMVLVGMANGEPMALYTSYFTPELGVPMGEKAAELSRQGRAFTSFDLYALVDGTKPARARQTFEAALLRGAAARLLRLKEPTAVFVVTSVVEDERGNPVEYRIVHYRGDRYRFSVTREVAD
ncbi:MAG: GntR family transcriptional regulator [Firmicutes bacterium]|nr:GntR family transcriptional regulator [Bacillota bacterium]